MKILFSPQVRDDHKRIKYSFDEDVFQATYEGVTDTFDFRDFPDGELEIYNEQGESLIETSLSIQPIVSAKKEKGILYLELLNYIGLEASKEERFPGWIDHTEYIPPKVGEVNGQDEMEE